MNLYQEWSFKENPFQPTALAPDSSGEALLVGREGELNAVISRICNPPAAVTLEGENGIGKTSLVNVAAYRCFSQYFKSSDTLPLYIPCSSKFQLSSTKDPEDFIDEVLVAVAQTLLHRAHHLDSLGYTLPSDSRLINTWLNSPYIESFTIALGPLGGGNNVTPNTSRGFERSGFRQRLQHWLTELFPSPNDGGVICIIDNLELLEESSKAIQLIEGLRDSLFSFPGIRWVFCGALGIVRSMVSTPRLLGYFHQPIQVSGIDAKYAPEVFARRIDHFRASPEAYMPITSTGFNFIYGILNNNLRNSLFHCDQYCQSVYESADLPISDDDKDKRFFDSIERESLQIRKEAFDKLQPRAKKLFNDIVDRGGMLSPSHYAEYGFNQMPGMRPYIKILEGSGLLISSKDENDSRRKSISVTSHGWLVSYSLKK